MKNYYEYFVNKGNHPDRAVILNQEKEYRFDDFCRYDAYLLAKLMIEQAYENHQPMGLRIVFNGQLILQYIMDDLDVQNSLNWLLRKERICYQTHHSSYYVFLKSITHACYNTYIQDERYAVCGGSFPIIMKDQFMGMITVTGRKPEEDHQSIIDGLKRLKFYKG